MPATTSKRAYLYRFDRQPLECFTIPGDFRVGETLECISLTGALVQVTYDEVKALCLVAEPGEADLFRRHHLFERRPKVPGLWTRFTLRDGDRLDGILPHNLLEWPEAGFLITPPKASVSRQRVFLPRQACLRTELRGVVGQSVLAQKLREPGEPVITEEQLRMFDS